MARKNRKLAKAPNRPAGMVAALFAAVSLGMLAYLQLQGTCEETGARIKQLERSREALKKKVDNEEVKWSSASAVPNMQRLMELHGIEMSWPAESQIVRVVAVRDDLPGDGAVSYAQK
jgi:hypothetical protein